MWVSTGTNLWSSINSANLTEIRSSFIAINNSNYYTEECGAAE